MEASPGDLSQVVDTIKRFLRRTFERVEQIFLSAHIKPEPRKKSSGDTATRRRVRLWKMEGVFYRCHLNRADRNVRPTFRHAFSYAGLSLLRCPSADKPSRYDAGYIPSAGIPAVPEATLRRDP